MKGFSIDPLSAALGFIAGILTVILFNWALEPLKSLWKQVKERSTRIKRWFSIGAVGHYREDLVAFAQKRHLGWSAAGLESIFTPPTLIIPPLEPQPDSGEILPPSQLTYLWPEMAALVPAKNPPSITLSQINSIRRAVLIAPDGSGKSAALAFLALKYARQDPDFSTTRLPIYVHLAEIELPEPDGKKKQKPVEDPLLNAVQQRGKRQRGRSIKAALRQALADMHAVVLLDGWDELELAERPLYTEWIGELLSAFPDNQYIVAGPVDGYGPLLMLNFTPLLIKNWSWKEAGQLARRWASVLGVHKNKAGSDLAQDGTPVPLEFWRAGQLPLDITLNLWLMFEGESPEPSRADLFRNSIQRILAPLGSGDISWPLEIGETVLCRLAHQNEHLVITRQQLRDMIRETLKSSGKYNRRIEGECVQALAEKSGLLIPWRKNNLVFSTPVIKHYFWSSFCASVIKNPQLGSLTPGKLAIILEFYFGLARPGDLVEKLLATPPGETYDALFVAAYAIREIPENQASKQKILIHLARLMANPQAPFALRERAIAALVDTRDEGVAYLLGKACKSPDTTMRILAAPGLGTLATNSPGRTGNKRSLEILLNSLNDDSELVKTAIIYALASTRAETALEGIIRILVDGKIETRRIAAEALAQTGADGRQVLLKALNNKNPQVRRTALFGLVCFSEPWAGEKLHSVFLEDTDWHVRSTAEDLIAEWESERSSPVVNELLPENMGWLVSWAAKRGEGVPTGERAFQVLERVLEQGTETEYRAAAARTLGEIGQESFFSIMKDNLHDPDLTVREAVFYAYVKLHRAWNKGLLSFPPD